MRIWNLQTSANNVQKLRDLDEVEAAAAVVFAPDGRRLLTASNHRCAIWDTETGKLLTLLAVDEAFNQGAWSPDGRMVAVQNGRGTRLFEAESGELVTKLPHPSPRAGDEHAAVAMDPGNNWLAEQLEDSSVILWDLEEMQRELRSLGMW